MSIVYYGGQGQSVDVDQSFDKVTSTLDGLLRDGSPTIVLTTGGKRTQIVVSGIDRVESER